MREPAGVENQAAENRGHLPAGLSLRTPLLLVLPPTVFAITAIVGLLLVRQHPHSVAIPRIVLFLLIGVWALSIAGLIFHHFWHWRRPVRMLMRAIARLRSGQGDPDELSGITGPLEQLVEQLQQILGELHDNRVELRRADTEMRQRIAARTDALERMISTLRLQASRDPLTGLSNRRVFDQHMADLVDQALKTGADLCLIMLDLDNFKQLNDTLGHAAGDQFLRGVGQLIRSTIRGQDMAFRYGGDEMAIILTDGGRASGEALSQRLTSLIDALGRTYHLPHPPGLSAGLAMLGELEEPTKESLLAEADRRLYATKTHRKHGGPPLALSA